ncbi:Protein Kr-h2 [Operophtera brumata]|uniref:Protein Kr-h2 n=1 Tax=Operophtera brumata TaxID=104452 RepID=A0A0L7L071_OPEBR|nr:Protein Kr-h2 [Operophtera brumata]
MVQDTRKMADAEPQQNPSPAGDTGPPKGMPALKAHVIANKIDVSLWAIRVLIVLCTFGYIMPLFNK